MSTMHGGNRFSHIALARHDGLEPVVMRDDSYNTHAEYEPKVHIDAWSNARSEPKCAPAQWCGTPTGTASDHCHRSFVAGAPERLREPRQSR